MLHAFPLRTFDKIAALGLEVHIRTLGTSARYNMRTKDRYPFALKSRAVRRQQTKASAIGEGEVHSRFGAVLHATPSDGLAFVEAWGSCFSLNGAMPLDACLTGQANARSMCLDQSKKSTARRATSPFTWIWKSATVSPSTLPSMIVLVPSK